jgi:phasin family protein
MTMAKNEMPAEQVRSVMTKNLEQAQGAIANYFQLVEKSISALPMGATDQTKTFRNYVEQSVAASFGLSDKLLRAKDLQDVLRIQTEFFQTQLKALTEQSKDLCGTANKATSDVTRVEIK